MAEDGHGTGTKYRYKNAGGIKVRVQGSRSKAPVGVRGGGVLSSVALTALRHLLRWDLRNVFRNVFGSLGAKRLRPLGPVVLFRSAACLAA